jgi:hypothetical protein
VTGFVQLEIKGPRGTVARGQIMANLAQLRASWMPDTMRAAGQYVRRVLLARQFTSQGSYLGGAWSPLSSSYLAWKRAHGYSSRIGVRTGAMIAALTGVKTDPFTMDGPMRKLSGRSTKIEAKPILEYSANHVTIGADVTEDGHEYTQHFDARRTIMGEGKLPSQAEWELGKLMSIPFLVSTRTAEFGDTEIDRGEFPSREVSQFLTVRALKAVA